LDRQGDRVSTAVCLEGKLPAGNFVIASGAWSDILLSHVGWRSDIRPVRGQIALLNVAPPLFSRVLMAGAEYLVPRPDGRVLVGSTEEDVGFDKRTTAEAIQHLLAMAITLVPGLGKAPVERCWAGLRPGSPDGRPFLGRVPGFCNLYVAAGHFRSGIMLSAGTGVVMKELLLGQPASVPLEPFALDRVQGGDLHK
jgi:glycine oxidase